MEKKKREQVKINTSITFVRIPIDKQGTIMLNVIYNPNSLEKDIHVFLDDGYELKQ